MWGNGNSGRNSSRGGVNRGGGSGYVTRGGGGSGYVTRGGGGGGGGRSGYQGGNNGVNNQYSKTGRGGRQGTSPAGGRSGYLGAAQGNPNGGGGYLGGNQTQGGGFPGGGGSGYSSGYLGGGGGNAQGSRGGGNGFFGRGNDGGRGSGRGGGANAPTNSPNSFSLFDKLKGGKNDSQPVGSQQPLQDFGSQGQQSGGRSNFRGTGYPKTFSGRGGNETNQGGRFGGKSFSTPAPAGGGVGNGYRNGFQPATNSFQQPSASSQGFGGFQKNSFRNPRQQTESDGMEDASNEPSGWGFGHQIEDPEPVSNSSPWAGIAGNTQSQSGYSSFQSARSPPISTTPAVPNESIGISLSNKIVEEDSEEEEGAEEMPGKNETVASTSVSLLDPQPVEKKYIDPRFLEFLSVKNDFLGDYAPEDITKYGLVPCVPPTPVR
jgi:hypothetical protein